MDNSAKNEILAAIAKLAEKVDIIQKQNTRLEERMTKLEQRVTELEQRVAKLEQNFAELKQELIETKDEIKPMKRSIIIMENEHGKKLDALFDAFGINNQKIENQNLRIKLLEKKAEKHDDEIYYLKKA